jgi:hypothetical protein
MDVTVKGEAPRPLSAIPFNRLEKFWGWITNVLLIVNNLFHHAAPYQRKDVQ